MTAPAVSVRFQADGVEGVNRAFAQVTTKTRELTVATNTGFGKMSETVRSRPTR